MTHRVLGLTLFAAAVAVGGSTRPCGAQPTPPSGSAAGGFVLFADEGLRTKGLTAHGGTIAVNQGALAATHGKLLAPDSDVVADSVRLEHGSECDQLFANQAEKTSAGCDDPQPFSSPLVADFAAACGFPVDFPSCDPGAPVTIDRRSTQTLPPGAYGELRVKDDATVHLEAGTYVFCKVKASRRARILSGAATIQVAGDVRLSNDAVLGPEGAGVTENDVVLQVAGDDVHFSRQTRVTARLCAPNADLSLADGGVHTGCFAARTIRVSRADVTVCAAETPTTTISSTTSTSTSSTSSTGSSSTSTSTTTTTLNGCAGACGNGVVDAQCGEVCDPNAAPIPCSSAVGALVEGSPTPGFLTCVQNCTVLDDGQCSTTTTTGASTTSTSTSASTSSTTASSTTSTSTTTTTDPCAGACGNGAVDAQCGEVCDTALPQTPCASPAGAFIVCANDCTMLDAGACTETGTSTLAKKTTKHRRK